MLDWQPIDQLPRDVAVGDRYLFCTIAHYIVQVTCVLREDGEKCWATGRDEAASPVLLDDEMAMVTHFAVPNYPELTEPQIHAAAARLADLDGRFGAYAHDHYDR